jgi:hypothetical protein
MLPAKSIVLIALVACFGVTSLAAQTAARKNSAATAKKQKAPPLPGAGTGGNTPHATTSAVIGPNRASGSMVTITYGRPFMKHPRTGEVRKVWGGLVKWDKADRLGADEATLLIAQHDLDIGGTTIPKGAYTLYIVPSETGTSRLAFSRNIGKWGVPVDEKNDVARVDLKKESLGQTVEQLTISVENATTPPTLAGVLKIKWEQTQFSLPFTVKK